MKSQRTDQCQLKSKVKLLLTSVDTKSKNGEGTLMFVSLLCLKVILFQYFSCKLLKQCSAGILEHGFINSDLSYLHMAEMNIFSQCDFKTWRE